MVQGVNPLAPWFILALIGGYSVFFLPFIAGPLRGLWRRSPWLVVTPALAAFVVTLTMPSDWNQDAGRWAGLSRSRSRWTPVGECGERGSHGRICPAQGPASRVAVPTE